MLPRAPSDIPTFSPEEWLIRRVVSEQDALTRLHAQLVAMESEPTTWFAPSRDAYLGRLRGLGEELRRAIAAIETLVLALHYENENLRHALVFGS